MSCEIDNQTPLHVAARPHEDARGRPCLLVVAKGCWRLDTGRLAPAEAQAPLRTRPWRREIGTLALDPAQRQAMSDRLHEDVVWLDQEVGPLKGRFDVLVVGHAHAPGGAELSSFDAALRIGARVVALRAFAPRRAESGAILGGRAVQVGPGVRRVPLSYVFAGWEMGLGRPASASDPHWLPWLSDPHGSSVPWGFGHWPESAAHRRRHAGTYDRRWREEREPLLPLDFDAAFHNTAHPDLQWPGAPPPGTPIWLHHLAPAPLVETRYPDLSLVVRTTRPDGTAADTPMRADTLIIEPDDNRLSVIHRALLPAASTGKLPAALRLLAARNKP